MLLLLLSSAWAGTTTIASPVVDSWFGFAIGGGGDVNDDGYTDLLAGAPGENEGYAWVWYGAAEGYAASPDQQLGAGGIGEDFGAGVSNSGDLNGDGVHDAAVGERSCAGGVYLYMGRHAGLPGNSDHEIAGTDCSSMIGEVFVIAEDLNGDGFDDLALGSSEAESNAGAVYLIYGGELGVSEAPDFIIANDDADDRLGSSLDSLGDIDGDGYGDLAFGSPGDDGGAENGGRVDLLMGGTTPSAGTSLLGDEADGGLGTSLARLGDLDQDGATDVAVGIPYANRRAGQVLIVTFDGADTVEVTTVDGAEESSAFGDAVAGAGDVNADGYDDLLIGARGAGRGDGAVHLILGASGGVAASSERVWKGVAGSDQTLGFDLAGLGDANDDGYDDVAWSALGDAVGTGALTVRWGEADADADGWGASEDCDEADGAIHPDAEDDPSDGVDADCDGTAESASDSGSDTAADTAADTGGAKTPVTCACASGGRGLSGWVGLAAALGLLRRRRA